MQFIWITAVAIYFVYSLVSLSDAIGTPVLEDVTTMTSRRITNIIETAKISSDYIDNISSSLNSSGAWPSVNYQSGCQARNADWLAETHLIMTLNLASAYYVSSPQNMTLLNKTKLALDFWFNNDYTASDCLTQGGVSSSNCPCGSPGLWNKNWYYQAIVVPSSVGRTCLLLRDSLTNQEKEKCTEILSRSYNFFFPSNKKSKRSITVVTGSNLLGVSSVGINLGLFQNDLNMVEQALDKFYSGIVVNPNVAGDGIQSDGSFMQHHGLLYNGGYGDNYLTALLLILKETKGTNLMPSNVTQDAFAILMSGSEWMITQNTKLNKLMWQSSVMGRKISSVGSGSISMNVTQIAESSTGWTNEAELNTIGNRLTAEATMNETANQNKLVGTRYFYNSDYMVHRAPRYTTVMKMYSTRTFNAECMNDQDIMGFHLSDGAIYNYITGDEYYNVFGAWDWNLVPGTTVDYGGTPLKCNNTRYQGLSNFVGGVTNKNTGIAVMDYLNPSNKNLAFSKTVFFFPSGYAIQVGSVTSKNKSAPLVTVLDQRKLNGNIYVNGESYGTNNTSIAYNSTSIWHNNIGYYFPNTENLFIDSRFQKTNWEAIGISTNAEAQQVFKSYIKHGEDYSASGLITQYIVQPNITQTSFENNIQQKTIPIELDFYASSPTVNAAYSAEDKTIAVAFWTAGSYAAPWLSTTISVTDPCVLLLCEVDSNIWKIVITDPSQTLNMMSLKITINKTEASSNISFPTGNKAGSNVYLNMVFQ